MDMDNRLGEFLRARRELTRPEDVGVAHPGRRRTPGLRRSEVALLAGVSTDYYVRLEQGRDRHPSAQVLQALARALRVEGDGLAHLFRLAAPAPRAARPAARSEVSPILRRLLDGWRELPAQVVGPGGDVLAANPLARALYAPALDGGSDSDGDGGGGGGGGGNIIRFLFLDPAARAFFVEWQHCAERAVADLRLAVGTDPDHPRLTEVVGELALKSRTFAQLWARHDVRAKTQAVKVLRHPLVGQMTLAFQSFAVNGAPLQQLVIYQADPGSTSEEALNLLGSLTARTDDDGPAAPPAPHPLPTRDEGSHSWTRPTPSVPPTPSDPTTAP